MHQHQLLVFMTRFKFVPMQSDSKIEVFTTMEYGPLYALLPPRKSKRQLTDSEFKHLRQHYETVYGDELGDLADIDRNVEEWYRCRVDKTTFHCRKYERANQSRLNHLVCIEQYVDANANVSYRARNEHMVPREFFVYVHFYCIHTLRGMPHMLMYSEYRKVTVHHGLVEDLGRQHDGFQDIRVLQHLCAKVTGYGGKVYFVGEPEAMENHLRDALL
jgi:hypothetical protein